MLRKASLLKERTIRSSCPLLMRDLNHLLVIYHERLHHMQADSWVPAPDPSRKGEGSSPPLGDRPGSNLSGCVRAHATALEKRERDLLEVCRNGVAGFA